MTNNTPRPTIGSTQIKKLRRELLRFYDDHGRTLPWRIRPKDRARGVVADPYAIWLSEIMCQQTSVVSAAPYWHKFLKRWPTVHDLARADRDEVLAAWAGLGYYARARNLHKCANEVVRNNKGAFPETEAALLALPGIGSYTAAAIAAICFDEATNVVDGNIERVIARLFAIATVMPAAKKEIRVLAKPLADPHRPGDYAQALMDLGAHVCTPKNPKCGECPWSFSCQAYAQKNPENFPVKPPKIKRPVRIGAVFYLEYEGRILLRQRPDTGLLGGMVELPTTEWTPVKMSKTKEQILKLNARTQSDISRNTTERVEWPIGVEARWIQAAPSVRNWQVRPQIVHHVFTHFTLYLQVYTGQGEHGVSADEIGFWHDVKAVDDLALPSLMRKGLNIARGDAC